MSFKPSPEMSEEVLRRMQLPEEEWIPVTPETMFEMAVALRQANFRAARAAGVAIDQHSMQRVWERLKARYPDRHAEIDRIAAETVLADGATAAE